MNLLQMPLRLPPIDRHLLFPFPSILCLMATSGAPSLAPASPRPNLKRSRSPEADCERSVSSLEIPLVPQLKRPGLASIQLRRMR
jgi:hypothetical protein